MAIGLQVFDASGVSIFDTSTRLGRILGVATLTGGTNGSLTNAGLNTGTPFWQVVKDGFGSSGFVAPTVQVSGTTLSWTWFGSASGSYRIIYGVY